MESEILKETSALQDLVLFTGRLKSAARETVLQTLRVYARGVADTEWRALSRCEPTDKGRQLAC